MRAFQRTRPGHAELRQVSKSDPAEGDVLVEVRYAGVNPFDMQVLRGEIGPASDQPLTLGAEATGTVDGELVQVSGGGLGVTRAGTFVDHVIVPRTAVTRLPSGADAAKVASIGIAGKTAWRAVHQLAKVGPEDVVLVLGASGGVGMFAAQLARLTGATVLGHTANAEKAARLEDLDVEPLRADSASTVARGVAQREVSVVLDPLGGDYLSSLMAVLRPKARAVTYGVLAGRTTQIDLGRLYGMGLTIHGTSGGTSSAAEAEEALAGSLDAVLAGRVEVESEVIPLAEAAGAFDRLAQRDVFGKLLLQP